MKIANLTLAVIAFLNLLYTLASLTERETERPTTDITIVGFSAIGVLLLFAFFMIIFSVASL